MKYDRHTSDPTLEPNRDADPVSQGCRFPWRAGNEILLLRDGPEFFPDMLEHIAKARECVRIEQYLVEPGKVLTRFVDELGRAVQRGVEVQFLLDPIGSKALSRQDRRRLKDAGITLRLFNRPLLWPGRDDLKRDHRKLFVIDDHTAYVGGACFTDDFWDPTTGEAAWHDLMLRVRGPVVEDVVFLFKHRWQRLDGRDGPPQLGEANCWEAQNGTGLARLAYTDGLAYRGLLTGTIERIRNANSRVWIVTPYFFPNAVMLEQLASAARRGVDVQLFLPGANSDHPTIRKGGQGFYTDLLESGVHIAEYEQQTLHAKAAIIDDWLSIGSCNFDTWGSNLNLEANIEAYDEHGLQQAVALFDSYRETCRPIRLPAWLRRSRSELLKQYSVNFIGRKVSRLLARSSRYRYGKLDE